MPPADTPFISLLRHFATLFIDWLHCLFAIFIFHFDAVVISLSLRYAYFHFLISSFALSAIFFHLADAIFAAIRHAIMLIAMPLFIDEPLIELLLIILIRFSFAYLFSLMPSAII